VAADFLLEIDGIKGESSDDKHKNAIELQSFSWGVSNSGTSGHGTGGGSGKASIQDLHFTTHVNAASPNLFLACAVGKHITKATLFARKQGKDKQQEYYKVTLEDLIVSSYQSGGHGGSNESPVDQVSLNAARWKIEYAPQKPDGTLEAYIPAGWDTVKNVKL
jgi:type VI secretion system secreted protein Hcp